MKGCSAIGPSFESETSIVVPGLKLLKFIESKAGIIATALTVYTLYEDYQNNNGWDIVKSMAVDVVGFWLSVLAGVVITELGVTLGPAILLGALAAGIIAGVSYLDKKEMDVN